MSEKERKGKGGGGQDQYNADQLCDSITSSTTELSSCSSINDLQSSALSSPLALHSCKLEPPLKLQSPNCNLSPPLKLPSINIKSPPAPFRFPTKVERDNGSVKRSMGLMKLRRQGSHPPATNNKSCHGSFNQAAAARELMASLERLSMKETIMGMNDQERERERALLAGEESVSAGSRRDGLMKAELPLTAKIAAAMDAEGLIGVKEEICLQLNMSCDKSTYERRRSLISSDHPMHKAKSRIKPRPASSAPAADRELRKMPSKPRSRWIILRRLRSTRPLLGKIWIKFKRVFSSSSRKHFQKKLFEVNTS